MDLIVCVDDRMGMAFHGRRQSRDSAVIEDIITLADGRMIGMDARSLPLFAEKTEQISADILPQECAYYFLEFFPPSQLADSAERIILYHWNRHYPSDVKFDVPAEQLKLTESTEFAGSSHEKITREVYIYEKEH